VGLSAFGRFSEPGLLVLISLLDGSKHGYAICNGIEQLSHRRLGPGTLCGAIGRLDGDGLIRAQRGNGRRRPTLLPKKEAGRRGRSWRNSTTLRSRAGAAFERLSREGPIASVSQELEATLRRRGPICSSTAAVTRRDRSRRFGPGVWLNHVVDWIATKGAMSHLLALSIVLIVMGVLA
jgi:DNA-binding PadR family transcriptional regulator